MAADRVVADPRPLLGRDVELARLSTWLDDVFAGRGQPLVLDGDPGIGKTTLLREACAEARRRGARTVVVTPIPGEANLALAGLRAVVEPLWTQVDLIAPAAVAPLRVALADPDATSNPASLCGGVVALLAAAAEAEPVLVVVDDGHWLDRSSADVLMGALSGLALDRVGLLVAVRRGEPHAFETRLRLAVDGVDEAAAAAIFSALGVEGGIFRQCWTATGGNPLALELVLRDLDDEQRRGVRPLPDQFDVPDAIAAALRQRLVALPDTTITALVVLAADAASSPAVLGAALEQVGATIADLEPAEDAGLIDCGTEGTTFTHPLLRSGVLALSPPSKLRAVRRALAAAHGHAGEPEARAWLLAASAIGVDDAAADALADVAASALARGATAVAATGFAAAARLSASKARRVERLIAAADATWVVGRVEEATTILGEAMGVASTAVERGEVAMLHGRIEIWGRGPRVARDRFLDAVEPLVVDAPSLASRLVSQAAGTAVASADVHGALGLARWALELAPDADLAATMQATVVLGYLESQSGDPGGAVRLEPIVGIASSLVDSDDLDVIGLLGIVGMCLTEAERFVDAERFLVAVVHQARRSGSSASAALSAAILAETHWRTGNWLEAAHLATNDVVVGATMPVNREWALAFLAHLDAAAGREEPCRARAAEALASTATTGTGVTRIWVGHALGLLELGLGRWAEAAEHLDEVASTTEALGRRLPGAVWWQGDHIEALLRAGRADDAAGALDRLEREGAVGQQIWPVCVAARGRAMATIDHDLALTELDRSVELAESIPAPFEAARSQLVRGERRLKSGRHDLGVDDLRRALARFERLGAGAFAHRTRQLLGDPTPAGPTSVLADLLTPAELRVAVAVAEGATNREVGEALFVSVKTVEFHLQNIFRKLQLRSRTELALRVREAVER